MFGSPKMPTPAPLPPAPTQDPALVAQQQKAAQDAEREAAQGGRASTIVAGNVNAYDQMQSIAKKRAASTNLLG